MGILDNPKTDALLNVAVFTPIAIYYARGKKPPDWLLYASLAYTGFLFFRDLKILMTPPEIEPPTIANLTRTLPPQRRS